MNQNLEPLLENKMNWIELNHFDKIEEVFQQSFVQPILLFKHSTRCSASNMILSRLERNWRPEEIDKALCYYFNIVRFLIR